MMFSRNRILARASARSDCTQVSSEKNASAARSQKSRSNAHGDLLRVPSASSLAVDPKSHAARGSDGDGVIECE
jgi:hypothetical protein